MKNAAFLSILSLIAFLVTGCAPTNWTIGPFERYEANPILVPSTQEWEAKDLFNPTAWTDGETVFLLYRAEDTTGVGKWNGTSRIGLARSTNGFDFMREPDPVLSPTEPWELPGGCEDPRVVKVDSLYYLTYTGYDGQTARLALATSPDLRTWTKHGPLFPDRGWTKSGAILDTPIDGRYWMYFGDTSIWAAHSTDLRNWTVVEEPVLNPRPGHFDSRLVEPGPQPILTEHGIVLLYNGARVEDTAYGAGQALFDAKDPTRLLARTADPFLLPQTDLEKFGQVSNVVFIEGLVRFKGRWLLYFGMGDSGIGASYATF